MSFSESLYAAAALLLVYGWVVYPALVGGVARVRRRRWTLSGAAEPAEGPPAVAILCSAHNEEAVIGGRIRNLQSLDYPADRLSILIGVDGSDDRTAEVSRSLASADSRIRVHAVSQRRGKAAMLKDLVALSREPVLVLTDANTAFRPGALRALVAPLRDPRVGGVSGRLILTPPPGSETREVEYWGWETRLKCAESVVDSCLGANGGIYAVRRERFWAGLPDNTIIDDFVIGMKVREQGDRMVFEPSAVATEEAPPSVRDEWGRRVRIGAGAFQALGLCRRCLSPRLGAFAWMFFSHKVLRWFTPHLVLLMLGVSAYLFHRDALARWPGHGWDDASMVTAEATLVLAGLVLIAAGAGGLVRRRVGPVARLVSGVRYLVVIQAAMFAGFLRFCRGNLSGAWRRTRRA